jgi:hypothetical protein
MNTKLYRVRVTFDDESSSAYVCNVSAPDETSARVAALQAGVMGRYIRLDERVKSVDVELA